MASAIGLCALWLASIAPLVAPGAEQLFGGVSRLALAAWPWIAALGLPRCAVGTQRDALRSALGAGLLAVPPLALGLALDLASGLALDRTLAHALVAVLCIGLLAFGAERAVATRTAARLHAIAWMVLVPGLPALVAALELGGQPAYGHAPRWLALLAQASPLEWAVGSMSRAAASVAEGSPGALGVLPEGSLAALAAAAALILVAELARRPRESGVAGDAGDREPNGVRR